MLCRKAFCEALLVIPLTLVLNSGLEAPKLIEEAITHHTSEHSQIWAAVNLDSGKIEGISYIFHSPLMFASLPYARYALSWGY
jgi:chaperonin GroEL (HSP60 family)